MIWQSNPIVDQQKQQELRASLAAVIRHCRQKAGLSQEELSFRSDLHRTYVSLVERSRKSLTVDSLASIASALGLSPSQLLKRAELACERRGRNG